MLNIVFVYYNYNYELINSEKEQEGELDEMDPLGEYYSLDDQLTPVEKLDKYFQSENLMERLVSVCYIIVGVSVGVVC